MITVPIYDTVTGKIVHVAPGVANARLKWNNASKTYLNSSVRGHKGRYLPASEAPVKEQPAAEAEQPESEEKPKTTRRTRKTTTNK